VGRKRAMDRLCSSLSERAASAGYRVIVPYLRGFGTSHFLSSEIFRNGQQSALAVDTIALMDALQIEKAILGVHDRAVSVLPAEREIHRT
jgi:pimeloyl-ACP methyl ester carboxylesterase